MGGHRHRAHPRPAPAVGDAEGLVEVEVTHVGPELPGLGHAHQCVQVGAVGVHLAPGLVDQAAHVGHGVLVDAVGAGVGDHHGRHPAGVGLDPGRQIVEADVAVVVAGHHHHPHPGQHGRRRVGAVGRRRDQTHVALALALVGQVAADGQQTGVLALAAGVGLERHGGVARDLHQHRLQLADEGAVAGGLVGRGEGVDAGQLGPRDRFHLGRGVELHGAAAERDHRTVEGQIPVGQAAQPPQHLVLAAVAVEVGVGQEARRAPQLGRDAGEGRVALALAVHCAVEAGDGR